MTFVPIKEVKFPKVAYDSFSRARVSETFAHARLLQLHDNLPELFSRKNNGTALQTYVLGSNKSVMTTAAIGDYAIAQTFQRYPYSAFDGQIWATTLSDFHTETNVDKRVGYFTGGTTAPHDTYDGMFFANLFADALPSCNIFNNGTEIRKNKQNEWNVDKLDGLGPSGINFSDWSKNAIIGADFQYLGLGLVRWYANIAGNIVLVHEDENAFVDLSEMYMRSPNQPIRYEIRQTGAGSGTMNQFCAAVSKEGSTNQLGTPKVARGDLATPSILPTAGTMYPMLGIRLKTTHLDDQVRLLNIATTVLNNNVLQWYLYRNPTLGGTAPTWNAITNSPLEYSVIDPSVTTITPAMYQELASDCTDARSSNEKLLDTALRLGSSIDGVRDEFILAGKGSANNTQVVPTINYVATL